MVKSKMACALSATALLVGSGVFGSAQTWADGCPTAESLEVAGQVSSEAELRYAITAADVSEVTIANDFTISCTNGSGDATYIAKDFTIDLNGKKVTANTPWAIDIEGEAANGKTLTIRDSGIGGTFEFNDAGIWVDSGANLTVESGNIRGIDGRGRGIVLQRGGKFTLNGGSISGDPIPYVKDGRTYWYNLVQVSGETTSADINGGAITVGSGEGRAFYSYAADTTMINGAISSNGDYAVEVDDADFTMSGGSISSKTFGFVMFEGTNFAMNGGTVEAGSIAISGNGTSTGDTITIGGNSTIKSGNLGIYVPQVEGVTTIDGGNIEAMTGVEVRAGTLNITGGNIVVSDGAEYEVVSNGNGSTTVGAAVAVAQHTTRKPINVNISGGTFIGPVAFSEADPQDGDPVDVNLSITGGAFVGDIVSENYDLKDFVNSGDFVNYLETEGGDVSANIDGAVVADTPIKFTVGDVDKSTLTLVDGDGSVLVTAYDFSLKDNNNVIVDVNGNDGVELTISVVLTPEQYEALKDKKVMVAFFENGVETGERIGATLEQREDGKWVVTFVTNHLSTYGIVGVNETEEEPEEETVVEAESPETGTMTAAGASASVAAMAAAVAVGILTSIVSFAYLVRRKD